MDYFEYGDDVNALLEDDWDWRQLLDQSVEAELEILEEELRRVEERIGEREQVHHEIVKELDSEVELYRDKLIQLYKPFPRKEPERNRLKDRIDEFYQEIRTEKRALWRDMRELERDRRKLLSEIAHIEDTNLFSEFL